MTTHTNPYATAEESASVIGPDTRTPAEKLVDRMLEDLGAFEQGAEYGVVLYKVAVRLAGQRDELLVALKTIAESTGDMKFDAYVFARAAIAKVEGGAA